MLGLGLHLLWPVDRLPQRLDWPARAVGTLLVALGLMLDAWAMLTLLRARTAILPFRPASRLVTSGPYRFTRNPIYAGMAMLYAGLSLGLTRLWPLALLPLVLLVIDRYVVAREERHLLAQFGDAYHAYRRRVPRWLIRRTH